MLANVYNREMNNDLEEPSLSALMVITAAIIKHMLTIEDGEVAGLILENIYLHYFVGLSSFATKQPFDPPLMVSIRYSLGQDLMEEFNPVVFQHAGVME